MIIRNPDGISVIRGLGTLTRVSVPLALMLAAVAAAILERPAAAVTVMRVSPDS
jgi:hypothetical protein